MFLPPSANNLNPLGGSQKNRNTAICSLYIKRVLLHWSPSTPSLLPSWAPCTLSRESLGNAFGTSSPTNVALLTYWVVREHRCSLWSCQSWFVLAPAPLRWSNMYSVLGVSCFTFKFNSYSLRGTWLCQAHIWQCLRAVILNHPNVSTL